jgi:phospho-N-acetylmuramoyl-pentapeptide-transferase
MYVLTKSVLALMIGFIAASVFGLFFVPFMKRKHLGQTTSKFVKQHKGKSGTPTMGGLIFIISTIVTIAALVLTNKMTITTNLIIVLFVFFGYALIGWIDDFFKIKFKSNEKGLTRLQKFVAQIILAIIIFYLYIKDGSNPNIEITGLNININLGFMYGFFILFMLVGTSNAVNLTDGLDGLAGGLSAIAFIAFALISLSVGFEDIGIFSLILVGSLIGFLVFNTYPAKVIMGDTGSLALGAVMGAIAILTHRELTLLVVASVFVIETLSVIIQVFWVQVLHRKLFLMTPLHHHFEKLGWEETDIVKLFLVFGLILSMAGIIFGVWL